MNYRDALNDTPEEYREYKLDRDRNSDISAAFDLSVESPSEADKAIADGKPRWIYHQDMGWKCMRLNGREERSGDSCLTYVSMISKEGRDRATQVMTESYVTEILPYGKSPPPAKPEESIPATPLYLLIKAAEAVCDLSIPANEPGLNGAVCKLQVALEEYDKYEKVTAVSEGPMHPDMIEAELQKKVKEIVEMERKLENGTGE